jgi:hypothetical protein
VLRALIMFLVLCALLVGGLYFSGSFDGPEVDETPPRAGTNPGEDDRPTLDPGERVDNTEPLQTPDVQALVLKHSARTLVIGRRPGLWNTFILLSLDSVKNMAYQSWYLNAEAETAGVKARDLPPLDSMPTASLLDDKDFDVLIIDNVIPEDLSNEFWEAVARRVRGGQMGLWFNAGIPHAEPGSDATSQPTVCPALTHPILSTLLPVAEAKPIKGEDPAPGSNMNRRVPGVFRGLKPFHITDAGSAHAATSLVPWTRWSRVIWESAGQGKDPLGTPFVYPVTKLTEGSTTLVDVQDGSRSWPAFIAGGADHGRVLWVGVPDMGFRPHFHQDRAKFMGIVVGNLVVWLTGQADG